MWLVYSALLIFPSPSRSWLERTSCEGEWIGKSIFWSGSCICKLLIPLYFVFISIEDEKIHINSYQVSPPLFASEDCDLTLDPEDKVTVPKSITGTNYSFGFHYCPAQISEADLEGEKLVDVDRLWVASSRLEPIRSSLGHQMILEENKEKRIETQAISIGTWDKFGAWIWRKKQVWWLL